MFEPIDRVMKKNRGGVAPRRTVIGGQDHMLSYITPTEAEVLMQLGGSGKPGPAGIPAYFTMDPGEAQEAGFTDSFDGSYSGGDDSGDSGDTSSDDFDPLAGTVTRDAATGAPASFGPGTPGFRDTSDYGGYEDDVLASQPVGGTGVLSAQDSFNQARGITVDNPYGYDGFFSRTFGIHPSKISYANIMDVGTRTNIANNQFSKFVNPTNTPGRIGYNRAFPPAEPGFLRSGVQKEGFNTILGPVQRYARQRSPSDMIAAAAFGPFGLLADQLTKDTFGVGGIRPPDAAAPGQPTSLLGQAVQGIREAFGLTPKEQEKVAESGGIYEVVERDGRNVMVLADGREIDLGRGREVGVEAMRDPVFATDPTFFGLGQKREKGALQRGFDALGRMDARGKISPEVDAFLSEHGITTEQFLDPDSFSRALIEQVPDGAVLPDGKVMSPDLREEVINDFNTRQETDSKPDAAKQIEGMIQDLLSSADTSAGLFTPVADTTRQRQRSGDPNLYVTDRYSKVDELINKFGLGSFFRGLGMDVDRPPRVQQRIPGGGKSIFGFPMNIAFTTPAPPESALTPAAQAQRDAQTLGLASLEDLVSRNIPMGPEIDTRTQRSGFSLTPSEREFQQLQESFGGGPDDGAVGASDDDTEFVNYQPNISGGYYDYGNMPLRPPIQDGDDRIVIPTEEILNRLQFFMDPSRGVVR